MDGLMLSFKKRCSFLESRWFGLLYGMIVGLNPLAMLPQLLGLLITRQVEGVSVSMFVIFWLIQTAVALGAIRVLDWKLWLSMTISVLETSTIISVVIWIRHF